MLAGERVMVEIIKIQTHMEQVSVLGIDEGAFQRLVIAAVEIVMVRIVGTMIDVVVKMVKKRKSKSKNQMRIRRKTLRKKRSLGNMDIKVH